MTGPLLADEDSHRHFWQAVGLALALFAILFGASYLITGNSQVYSPSLYILSRAPGKMHTVGGVMLVIGVLMLAYCLHPEKFRSKRVLHAYCGLSAIIGFTIIGSWFLSHHVIFGAPWSWFAFTAISGAMIVWPPPPKIITQGSGRA